MIQKRCKLFVLISVISMFLAGCGRGDEGIGGAPTTPFLGGSEGLEISFLEGSPPEEVTDSGTFEFQALVKLKNNGEFDLTKDDVEVSLAGFFPEDFSSNTPSLKGKNPEDGPTARQRDSEGNIIESVETFVTFPPKVSDAEEEAAEAVVFVSILALLVDVLDPQAVVDAAQGAADSSKDASDSDPGNIEKAEKAVAAQNAADIIIAAALADGATKLTVSDAALAAAITAGTERFFNFKSNLPGNNVYIFRADVCYLYQTKAVSEICVLANQIDVVDDAICDPIELKSVFSSSSPLQITSFRQSVAGKDKIQFSFDIVHSGSGDVFDPTTTADCPKDPSNRRKNENEVRVTVKTGLTDDKLKCVGLTDAATESSKVVKLVNGKRTITCTQELDAGRADFKKTVDITVDFNYLESADTEVLVKHLIG